jgi:hypothetical protein
MDVTNLKAELLEAEKELHMIIVEELEITKKMHA